MVEASAWAGDDIMGEFRELRDFDIDCVPREVRGRDLRRSRSEIPLWDSGLEYESKGIRGLALSDLRLEVLFGVDVEEVGRRRNSFGVSIFAKDMNGFYECRAGYELGRREVWCRKEECSDVVIPEVINISQILFVLLSHTCKGKSR